MSRRQANPNRRYVDSGSIPFAGALHTKSHSYPILSISLLVLAAVLLVIYTYSDAGSFRADKEAFSKPEADRIRNQGENCDFPCTFEVQRVIPFLKKAYGDSMRKVLHVGPDTCSVVSKLLKQEETEAWGVEPYDFEGADEKCRSLVRKGIVREADIKFSLPYRENSFSLVIVSDALEYLSPRYLNKTLPDLATVSTNGFVIFTGFPGHQDAKVSDSSKLGRQAKAKLRSPSWWIRFFVQTSLEENEAARKKFEEAAPVKSLSCQVFHLNSYH